MALNPPAPMDYPFSPASCLPPELLIKIFECLVRHSRSNPTPLLQVCHRWADIASSVSDLWSTIDFSSPPEPLLQRCADRPIEVILSSSPTEPAWDKRRAAKRVLLLYSGRIRKLVLDLPACHLQEIERGLSATFPTLVEISISIAHDHHEDFDPEDFPEWSPVAIPSSSIRHLKLLLVKTPWTLGRFQNLVEFFLHDQQYADHDPPMEVFLGILESSPQLTTLSVANAGPRLPLDTPTLPPATRVIHLPNLQHLYFEQVDACDIGWMLIHLEIPESANVRIFVDYGGRTDAPLEPILDLVLPNHPGFPHLTDLPRCTYAVNFEPSCVITAHNFALRISWNNGMRRHFDCFMMPFLRRTAGAIEDLTVIHDQPTRYSTTTIQWDQIFGTLRFLRKLRVEQSPGEPDFSIWSVFKSSPCPLLRDLRLSFLAFGKEPRRKGDGRNQRRLVERLVDYCAEGIQRGYRLNSLVIEAPGDPPPGLASLLTPYADHVEIREEFLSDEGVWDLEFGSRHVFDSLPSV